MTEAVVSEFMTPRPLEWNGNPNVPRADLVVPVVKTDGEAKKSGEGEGEMTKSALKKQAKLAQIAQKKAEKEAAKAAAKEAST